MFWVPYGDVGTDVGFGVQCGILASPWGFGVTAGVNLTDLGSGYGGETPFASSAAGMGTQQHPQEGRWDIATIKQHYSSHLPPRDER